MLELEHADAAEAFPEPAAVAVEQAQLGAVGDDLGEQQLLERVASWPDEDIEKLDEAAREIEAWRSGEYRATEDELRAVDEAIAELDRGEVASEAQVKAAFAKFRGV